MVLSGPPQKAAPTQKRELRRQLLGLGGKKIFQNCGEGVVNSTGTREPSALITGGRTTWASTFFWVLGFSMEIMVPVGRPWGKMIIAPLALTVCVVPGMGLALPSTCTRTGILRNTR